MGVGQGEQLGHPLIQKQIQNPPAVFHQGAQALPHPGVIGEAEFMTDGPPQEPEGDHGKADDGGNDFPAQFLEAGIFHLMSPGADPKWGGARASGVSPSSSILRMA